MALCLTIDTLVLVSARMQIRPAIATDYPAICQLVTSPEELFWVWPKGQYPLDVPQLELLAQQRKSLSVATLNDQIIGFANVYEINSQQYAFIGNVIIAKAQRGKGFGKTLLEYMRTTIFTHYAPEARISVFNNNTPALLLYSRVGFTPYAVEQRLTPHQQPVALIHMQCKQDVS